MGGKSEAFVQRPVSAVQTVEQPGVLSPVQLDYHSLRKPPPAAHHPPSSRNSVQRNSLTTRSPRRNSSRQYAERDPEKGSLDSRQMAAHRPSHATTVFIDTDDDDSDDEEDGPKRHAVWILAYLSILSPLLTFPIALYTLLLAIAFLFLTPVFLIMKKGSLSTRFHRLLASPIGFQLGLIYTPYDSNSSESQSAGSVGRLMLVNLLAPIYALITMVAAWIGGIFWLYTGMLGNPDGKEEHDDGRDTVLRVRDWWESWLLWGFK